MNANLTNPKCIWGVPLPCYDVTNFLWKKSPKHQQVQQICKFIIIQLQLTLSLGRYV